MAAASARDTASESSLSSHVKDSTSASAAAVAATGNSTVTASGDDSSEKASQNCCTTAIASNPQSPTLRQSRQQQRPRRLRTGAANSKRGRAGRNCSSSSSSSSSCSTRGASDHLGCASGNSRSSSGSSSRSSSRGSRSRSSSVNSRGNYCSSKDSGGSCDDSARDDQSLVVHVDVSEDNLDSDLTVRRAGSVSASGDHQGRSRPMPDGQQQQNKQWLQPPKEDRQHPELSAAAAAAAAASQPLRRPGDDSRCGASTSGDPALARESRDGSRLQPVKKASKSQRKVKGKKPSKLGVQNLLTQSGLLRLDPAPVKRLLAAGTKHRSLWISGLSISTKICDLRTMFGQYGKVMSASIIKKEEERSLTFHGIVTMATSEEADRCRRSLNGSQYRGRVLEVITHVAAISRQVTDGVNNTTEAGRDRKPVLPGNRSPDRLTSGLQPTGEKHRPRDAIRKASLKPSETISANIRERSPLQRSKPDNRVSGSTDRFLSQDRVLQQLHSIADETQRLKEARAKLVADKEFLRSERQLAEMARSELGDVCRQRLRLEREIHELQERCARERADLMRLQELRVKELPPPPLPDNFRREEMLTATANCALPVVGASPAHNSDRTAAGWAGWQRASPEASFSVAVGTSVTGQRAAVQGPVYSSPSVSTDQLLCIGGVLYRVGGGDGNVLVLSRLAMDVQPVVIPGISRVLNHVPVDSPTNVAAATFPQGRDLHMAVQQPQPIAKEPATDRHCVGSGTSLGLLVDAPQRRSSGGDSAAVSATVQNVADLHVVAPGGS